MPKPMSRNQQFRIKEAIGLPMKRADGEEVHALRAMDSKNILLFSPIAYQAYKDWRAGKHSDATLNLLNKALDQCGIGRLNVVKMAQ